jgi:dipeptidyl aminopeptidase/acylaminoacyl peptidase
MKPEQSSLWYTTLQKSSHRYQLDEKNVINALKGTSLVCPIWPSDPFTGSCYDISANGLLVTAKDPQFNPAHLLISGLWYCRIGSFTESDSKLQFHKITAKDYHGSISAATFSSDGKKIAFLQQKEAGKETDWNRIFVIDNLKRLDLVVEISVQKGFFNKASWGLTPTSVVWSNESRDIYVTAEEKGNGKLFLIPVDLHRNSEDARAGAVTRVSVPLSEEGTVSSLYPLPSSKDETRLFVNKTTLTQDSIFTIILCPYTPTSIEISSEGNLHLGLSTSQVSEIIFKGHGNYRVQAWVIKPSNFNPNKKYPLALLIHGGPYGAWLNAWSTRWNPLIFAEQGYIVVAPNPTGSSGFGNEFAEAIKGDWGGACYHDLEECIDYVERKMPYVDTERMVALGASFGGYMVNWIAGQPLGKKFKALVCHDGIFSNYNMLASDIVAPLADDMGGPLWTHKERWDKFDPAQFTQNWTTPMLIIHSDLDYRCPITEGLAAFSVCQQRDIESRFLNFPDENHFVQKPENSLKWHRTVLGWINKYAKVEGGIVLEPPVSEPRRNMYQGD